VKKFTIKIRHEIRELEKLGSTEGAKNRITYNSLYHLLDNIIISKQGGVDNKISSIVY